MTFADIAHDTAISLAKAAGDYQRIDMLPEELFPTQDIVNAIAECYYLMLRSDSHFPNRAPLYHDKDGDNYLRALSVHMATEQLKKNGVTRYNMPIIKESILRPSSRDP